MRIAKEGSSFDKDEELFDYEDNVQPIIFPPQDRLLMVCVSINSDTMYEIVYMRNACLKCDVDFLHVNFVKKEHRIEIIDGKCVLCMGSRMYELDNRKTIILKRHARMSNTNVINAFRTLKKHNFLIINNGVSTTVSSNKAESIKKFDEFGIPYPKSLVLDSENIDDFKEVIKKFDVPYPVIAKVNRGSQGNGVFIFDSPQSLKGVAQYILSKKDIIGCDSIVVQEKIEASYDLRIHVLRRECEPNYSDSDKYEVFASMKRNTLDDDYRSNASLGANYEYYEPTQEEIDLAIRAARSVGCYWCGVDIMRDARTNKPYVLEVNCTPSLKGITKVSLKDPSTEFVKAIKDAFVTSGRIPNTI